MNRKLGTVSSLFLATIIGFASACSKPAPQQNVVIDHQVSGDQRKDVTIVLNKKAILDNEFLYGADLQYSSSYAADMDLFNQSMVLGLIPAKFRIWGSELQLIAENKRLFPSDVNHPDQIISRYRILNETDNTLTVTSAASGIYLSQLMQATDPYKSPDAQPPRDLWVRSFEVIADKNLILQESTVQLQDGTSYEIMESLMPKSANATGADFKTFVMNPDDPVGADSGPVARYRLLGSEKIFMGEQATSYAQHFDISKNADGSGGTIEWWVTRNIPEDYLQPVKLGVEAWNRYFREFQGIKRDVLVFRGKLPEGVKLGDPRYNVIAWDNRLVAGAAYETQAADPFTGKQTHSLIYMPAAWLQIGQDFWKDGNYSERGESVSATAKSESSLSNRLSRVACIRDTGVLRNAITHGILSGKIHRKEDIETFGIELLKGVIFHEVGHSLGLAHNFKGSLSYDLSKPDSVFSTSIMDYNDYQVERASFKSVDSSDGPELAYDRQALSTIYNDGKDVKDSDPVLPACADAEADAEDGGVDPLCIRYDLEKDPTLSVVTAFDRVTKEKSDDHREMTLAEAVRKVPGIILTQDSLKEVKNEETLNDLADSFVGGVRSALKFYYLSSTGGVMRSVRTNIKSLLQFRKDVLPDGYSEREMRERAFSGVQKALSLTKLPETVSAGLAEAQDAAIKTLAQTEYVTKLEQAKKDKTLTDLKASISKKIMAFETDKAVGLPRVRAKILESLKRHDKVPFFFGKLGDAQMDFETAIVGMLSDVVTAKDSRGLGERGTAATALASYSKRLTDKTAIQAVVDKLEAERALAVNNESREATERMIALLKK